MEEQSGEEEEEEEEKEEEAEEEEKEEEVVQRKELGIGSRKRERELKNYENELRQAGVRFCLKRLRL